jgi:uncharacterized protein YhjY with autotransporter beta-barrel domain
MPLKRGKRKEESESEESEESENYLSQSEEEGSEEEDNVQESLTDEWNYKFYKKLAALLAEFNCNKEDVVDFHSLLLGWLQKNPQP